MTDTYVPSPALTDYDEQATSQQYADAHELSNRIQYLTQAAPYLANDPEALSAIAQQPIPTDQLGYYAASASAQLRLNSTLEDLQRMEPGRQRAVFAMMTPTQQAALQQMGYQPQQTNDTGSDNPILGAVGKSSAFVMGGVNKFLTETPIVSDVFEIMNKLQNGVNTLYRSIRTDDQSELATAAMIAGGVIAAPFTGGLSLAATAGVIAGAGLAAGTAAAILTNPSDYIEATKENWHGESVFTGKAQVEARRMLQNSGLDVMARDLGWEMDPYETVRLFASTPNADSQAAYLGSIDRVLDRIVQPGDARRQQLADKLVQLMMIPEFKQAVTILENSKTSFGRDVARLLGMNPTDTGYNLVSGGMDALFTIVTDPTLAATGAFKWQRAVRLGVPIAAGEDTFETVNAIARRAEEVPSIGRAYDEIAHAVNSDQPHLLWRRVPDAKGMYDDLWNYKRLLQDSGELEGRAFGRDDIFDWLRDSTNYQSMLAGHGVKQGFGRLLLPTYGWSVPMTNLVVTPEKFWEGAKAAIDFADDNANAAHLVKIAKQAKKLDPGAATPTMRAVDNIKGGLRLSTSMDDEWNTVRAVVDFADRIPIFKHLERGAGSLLNSLIEMMPATNSVSMVGPQAFDEIQRMVGLGRTMGMSSMDRKLWFDTIMQQDNIEHRINAAMSYMDSLLSAGGMRTSERGKALADEFINKVKQRYSLTDADEYLFGSRVTSRAIHPYQHAFDLPVPSLKELRQYAQKGMIWKYALRATDVELVDTAMNKIWKPLVLLRLGFISRAAGEELLALMARAGPSTLISEFGARSIAEGRLHSAFLDSAVEMQGITAAQKRAIERMRYVAHVRPLERMFQSWDWSRPAVRILGRYSDFVRTGLERGLLPGIDMAVPESRRLALIGKSGGFRNAILTGIDQDMIRYAESFGRVHSSSIMKELSSANASVAHDLAGNPADPNDFSLRWVDPSGELQTLGFVAERGHFKIYRKGDPFFDRMAHGQVAQILNDPIEGPAYVHVTSRWAPDTLPDEKIHSLLARAREVQDYRMQAVLRELLTGNDWVTSNWQSALRGLQKGDEDFGVWMRGAHPSIGTEHADHQAVLDTLDQWIYHRFPGRGGLGSMNATGLSGYGQALREQNKTMRSIIDELSQLTPQERAWAGQFLDLWGRVPDDPRLLRSFEEYQRELKARLYDRHFDPENQQLVSGLTYANRTSDGSAVAAAPLEGRTRIFIPQMTAEAYGRMVQQLRMGGMEQFTNDMMQLWAQSQAHFSGLHMEQMQDIVARFVNQLAGTHPNVLMQHAMDVGATGRQGALIPLTFLGVDDPDVAARLSQFMNATLSGSGKMTIAQRFENVPSGQVGLLDLSDDLRKYAPYDIDGAKRAVAHPAHDSRIQIIEPERTETFDVRVPTGAGSPAVPPYGGSADAIVMQEFENFIRSTHTGAVEHTLDAEGNLVSHTLPVQPTPVPPTKPATAPAYEIQTVTDTIPATTAEVRGNVRVTDRVIHTWALDHEYLTPRVVSLADQPIVTLPDGTRAIGADPREAISQGVDKAVTDWMAHVSSGGGQERIVKGVAFRDAHGHQQIPVGTRINMRDELYNAKGDIIDYDDPEVYSMVSKAPGENIHDNWSMLGPLIRDATDHMFGTSYILPDTRSIKNLPAHIVAERAEKAPLPGMREFRGHYSHMSNLENPPMVALGPALKPITSPTRWEKVMQWGFEDIISPSIDAIVRRPLAFHMFAEAMRENERALRWGLSPHLFGNEETGQVGALSERFAKVLANPDAMIDVAATAEAIRTSAKLMNPDLYANLDGLDDLEVVSALFGQFGDDVILHGSLAAQRTAAKQSINDMMRREITARWSGTDVSNKTIYELYQQTRQAAAKRLFQLDDGRWTARQATTVGRSYIDVPADRVSSVLSDLNGTNRKAHAAVFDVHGAPKQWVRGTPAPIPTGPAFDEVVAGAYRWATTGKQPRMFDGIHGVYGARLETDYKDLVAQLRTELHYGQWDLNEWSDAIKASEFIDTQPRWALPMHTSSRPVEGVLDAYQEQLGDLLSRKWDENAVQSAVAALPKPLREALDKNSWSVLSASYKARARMMDTVETLAAQRAINNSIPYLDSHEIRSQAGEYVRGFFPFMYAEQNFLKRWARTLRVAPDALRKGQLAYHGLMHLGVIRTDSQGRDWYVYPGAGLLAETVNRALQSTGAGEVLPTGVVFASQTQNMVPGFNVEQTGLPSANPLVSIPMGWVASNFHELRPLQETIVGKQGVTQGGLSQFVPATLRRLWNVAGNENSNVQYASAMMSAIAILEHNGHGLPADATKNQLDDYIRRVRQHTRAILATQAFVGFITPGSPSIQFTGDGALSTENLTGLNVEIPADVFRTEYLELVQELGIEQGTMRYLELNPDHTIEDMLAYTVGQSTSVSGAPLPATHEAVAFADNNQGWIGQYPMAAAWMLPQPDATNDKQFDEYAYVQQTISGMRQRRTPTEFLEALKFREGSLDYFKSKDRQEQMLADAKDDPARRKVIQDAWDEWATMHKATHPVFADVLEGGESRQRRQRVLDEVRTALADPATPKVAHLAGMADLVRTFDAYQAQHRAMSESRTQEAQRQVAELETTFENLVTAFLWNHPELEPFWLSVLRPEASL